MTHIKRAALTVCLVGVMLLGAGCGGRAKRSEDGAKQTASLTSVQAVSQDAAPKADSSEAVIPDGSSFVSDPPESYADSAEPDTDVLWVDFPGMPEDDNMSLDPPMDDHPVTYMGELPFTPHAYGVHDRELTLDIPGTVCKTRGQLERLVQKLEAYSPYCAKLLETCDDLFFTQKAILFAAVETRGHSSKYAHKVTRGEDGVRISTDYHRSYGLPGPYNIHTTFFLIEVDKDKVSYQDAVEAVHEPYNWIDEALPKEGRLTEPGVLVLVDWKDIDDNLYDEESWNRDAKAFQEVKERGLDTGIFRSREETDAWFQAIDCYLEAAQWPEQTTLYQKIDSLLIDYDTTALAVVLEPSYSVGSSYLGAAIVDDSVRIGILTGSTGCTPDNALFIALQPVPITELDGVNQVEANEV